MDKFDLKSLNKEFVQLLEKHENDTCVTGASKEEFLTLDWKKDNRALRFWIMAYNAWDELCEKHPGLRESGLGWFAGADLVGYDNPYDLYIGTGDEKTIPEQKQTLESMISAHAYDEIVSKVKEQIGEESFDYIFPAIKKALEEGSGKVRKEILINWLNVDSMRVCTYCGKIMGKGWYLNCAGYACSDECAAKSEGITMEQFEKWRIYKDDIVSYLEDEGEGRKIEDLTKEECDEIIDAACQDCDYYYTEWY